MYKIENTVDLSSRFEEVLGLILTLGKLRSPFPPNLSRFILTLFEKKKKKTIYQVKLPLVIGIVSFNFDVGGFNFNHEHFEDMDFSYSPLLSNCIVANSSRVNSCEIPAQ